MEFNGDIPLVSNENVDLPLDIGKALFILGANGTGKSSLMQRLFRKNAANAVRISAHRQTWFLSNSVSVTGQQKKRQETNINASEATAESRWKDDYAAQRTNLIIYDLLDAENIRARAIAEAVTENKMEQAQALANERAPLAIINELLAASNLPIVLTIQESESIVASKSGGEPYSIAELSDGERNALLIGASVLTAKAGSLLLIDEPERHLHRSIISPFLTMLIAQRPDCAFVISTHDIMIPIDNPDARVLLVRGCTYQSKVASAWDADLLPSESELDDSLRFDILGSRRRVIFVEGTNASLDKPLYSLIFPNASVVSKGSCRDVELAVSGLKDSAELHWIQPFGIIDRDQRSDEEVAGLAAQGVYALSVYSVEAIYYHSSIQAAVARRQAELLGEDAEGALVAAKGAGLAALSGQTDRLAARLVEKQVREQIFRHLPQRGGVLGGDRIDISINVADLLAVETARLNSLLNDGEWDLIAARYPVRETGALSQIAAKLGFTSRTNYQRAVRKIILDDLVTRRKVENFFGKLVVDLDSLPTLADDQGSFVDVAEPLA